MPEDHYYHSPWNDIAAARDEHGSIKVATVGFAENAARFGMFASAFASLTMVALLCGFNPSNISEKRRRRRSAKFLNDAAETSSK
jgi:hypothetical protein